MDAEIKKEFDNEKWKPIKGFEGYYEVSSLGRIRSKDRIVKTRHSQFMYKGRVLLARYNEHAKGTYVSLSVKSNIQRFFVHRLVAIAFIPNPENKPHVNHLDADRSNNKVSNLEWCTASENLKHCVKLGRHKCPRGEKHPRTKLTECSVNDIMRLIKLGLKNKDIASIYGIKASTVSAIKLGGQWNHVTGIPVNSTYRK